MVEVQAAGGVVLDWIRQGGLRPVHVFGAVLWEGAAAETLCGCWLRGRVDLRIGCGLQGAWRIRLAKESPVEGLGHSTHFTEYPSH